MERLIFKNETYQLIGVCMEVHRILGHSFSEIVYKDAIEVEAASKKIGFEREKEYDISYKGKILKHKYLLILYFLIMLFLR